MRDRTPRGVTARYGDVPVPEAPPLAVDLLRQPERAGARARRLRGTLQEYLRHTVLHGHRLGGDLDTRELVEVLVRPDVDPAVEYARVAIEVEGEPRGHEGIRALVDRRAHAGLVDIAVERIREPRLRADVPRSGERARPAGVRET